MSLHTPLHTLSIFVDTWYLFDNVWETEKPNCVDSQESTRLILFQQQHTNNTLATHYFFFSLRKIRHQQHTEQHTLLIIVEGCY